LVEDFKIRKFIKNKLYSAGISRIEIERAANKVKINVHAAKPGLIIGKGGAGIEELRKQLEKMTQKNILINITEIKVPELDAQIVAENIASQLEKRISFRRAMKQAMARAMRLGAKGIKTAVSDYDRLQLMDALHQFNLFMQLTLSITPIEFGFTP